MALAALAALWGLRAGARAAERGERPRYGTMAAPAGGRRLPGECGGVARNPRGSREGGEGGEGGVAAGAGGGARAPDEAERISCTICGARARGSACGAG